MTDSWVIEKAVELSKRADGLKLSTEEEIQIRALCTAIERAKDYDALVKICTVFVKNWQSVIEGKAAA